MCTSLFCGRQVALHGNSIPVHLGEVSFDASCGELALRRCDDGTEPLFKRRRERRQQLRDEIAGIGERRVGVLAFVDCRILFGQRREAGD